MLSCPRQRRMNLGRTETVHITSRATNGCFYFFEIPPSRMAKQVIGPRVTRSCLDHLSDENLDEVNTAVETCVSEDILKMCVLPLNLSPNNTTAQLGMTAIVKCAHRRTNARCSERTFFISQRASLPAPRRVQDGRPALGS